MRAKIGGGNVDRGCFKTHARNCVTCAVLKETKKFKSTSDGRTHVIKGSLTCTSKGVIYLVNCLDCKKQYVGETGGELRIRHRGHRQEIRNNLTPLGQHFNSCKNLELIAIESTGMRPKAVREGRKLRWIYILNTLQPNGINRKDVKLRY